MDGKADKKLETEATLSEMGCANGCSSQMVEEIAEKAENSKTRSSVENDPCKQQDLDEKEWAGYKGSALDAYVGSMLIMEAYRLVPFLKDDLVKFHPYNMPEVTLGKVDIVAQILTIQELDQSLFMQIDVIDGTGSLSVKYNKEFIQKDEAAFDNLEKNHLIRVFHAKSNPRWYKDTKKVFKVPPNFELSKRPGTKYPDSLSEGTIELLDTMWAVETDNGLVGKQFCNKDYVRMWGFFSLDFANYLKPTDEITYDCLSMSKLLFIASRIVCISEKTYNFLFRQRIVGSIKDRYDSCRSQRH